jgi:hypothetical protein
MQNKVFRFGPVILTNVLTGNLLNPPTVAGGVNAGTSPCYLNIKHLRIANKTATAATFSLWLGATGANVAGTEFVGTGVSVAPNSAYDWYSSGVRLDIADFLVGGSNTAAALTISGEGEIGVAG